MTGARLDIEPTKETVLEEYHELLSYGVAEVDAAKRLDVPLKRIKTWLTSDIEVARRHERQRERRAG